MEAYEIAETKMEQKKAQNQGTCWFREYAKIAKSTIHVAMCLKNKFMDDF